MTLAMMAIILAALVAGCSPANTVSNNLSQAADNFEIQRRVVFFNGITDEYLLIIEGRCSIKADGADSQLEVTCMTSPDDYKKHFLGLSDNVTYFVEQLEGADVDEFRHRVFFRPKSIVPDIDLQTSDGDVGEN